MSRASQKLSFSMCPETCPNLDNAVYSCYQDIVDELDLDGNDSKKVFDLLFEKHIDQFKNSASHPLRDALDIACERILDLESQIED